MTPSTTSRYDVLVTKWKYPSLVVGLVGYINKIGRGEWTVTGWQVVILP